MAYAWSSRTLQLAASTSSPSRRWVVEAARIAGYHLVVP